MMTCVSLFANSSLSAKVFSRSLFYERDKTSRRYERRTTNEPIEPFLVTSHERNEKSRHELIVNIFCSPCSPRCEENKNKIISTQRTTFDWCHEDISIKHTQYQHLLVCLPLTLPKMISPLSSSTALVASLWIPSSVTAFVTRPAPLLTPATTTTTTTPPAIATTRLFGYLDDLSKELYAPDGSSSREEVDTDKMRMDKEQIDRYGVGSWEGFVDFDEFDGGDGQMGVAGKYQKITYCALLSVT